MREAQTVIPCLSEDLKCFARTIRADRVEGAQITEEIFEIILTAFDMFSIEAKALEDENLLLKAHLAAAGCRDAAASLLADPRDAAICDGVAAGRVIDLRAVFLDEQDWAAERREKPSNDGDAA